MKNKFHLHCAILMFCAVFFCAAVAAAAPDSAARAGTTFKDRFSIYGGVDVLQELEGMPSLNLQPRLGVGYSMANWHFRLGVQNHENTTDWMLSDRTSNRGFVAASLFAGRRMGKVQPYAFGAFGKGTYDIRPGGSMNISESGPSWQAGLGVGWFVFSLAVAYYGPEILLSESAPASGLAVTRHYRFSDGFIAMLGLTLEFNLRGKLVRY